MLSVNIDGVCTVGAAVNDVIMCGGDWPGGDLGRFKRLFGETQSVLSNLTAFAVAGGGLSIQTAQTCLYSVFQFTVYLLYALCTPKYTSIHTRTKTHTLFI